MKTFEDQWHTLSVVWFWLAFVCFILGFIFLPIVETMGSLLLLFICWMALIGGLAGFVTMTVKITRRANLEDE